MKGLRILTVWLIFAGILCGIWFGFYHEERVEIPVRNEIENAVAVKAVENKFVEIKGVGFGGAGAGGIAVPQVTFSSPQTFLQSVPEDEIIYVSFEKEGRRVLKKVYSAFNQEGNRLFRYEDIYQYGKYWVEGYNSESVYFYYNNINDVLLAPMILVGIFGLAGVILISVFIGVRES
jgi:hypothetical protein